LKAKITQTNTVSGFLRKGIIAVKRSVQKKLGAIFGNLERKQKERGEKDWTLKERHE